MSVSRTGYLGISHGWWVVICIVYTLSPIDLVPALLLGPLGIVDNLGVACFGFFSLVRWAQARSAGLAKKSQSHTDPITSARVVDVGSAQTPSPVVPCESAPQVVNRGPIDTVRLREAQTATRDDAPSEFEVQIVDPDDGTSRWIAVLAATADQARILVASKGGDGQIAKIRLKQFGAVPDVGATPEAWSRA